MSNETKLTYDDINQLENLVIVMGREPIKLKVKAAKMIMALCSFWVHENNSTDLVRVRPRDEDGNMTEPDQTTEPQRFISVDGLWYPVDWVKSGIGLRVDQLKFVRRHEIK